MSGDGLQHLVLVGAGRRHQAVLTELARKRPVNLRITLVSHTARPIEAARLPDFVMGFDTQQDCEVDLGPLLKASGALLKVDQVAALNTVEKSLTLANEEVLRYDLLGIDTDHVQERTSTEARLPGALERALFTQPLEPFFKLWPHFLQLTQRKTLNIAVIGRDIKAAELALAVAARLAHEDLTQAHRVTLVMDGNAATVPEKLAKAVSQALAKAHVTVLRDTCVGISEVEIQLTSGMRLACDAPIVAVSSGVPSWLKVPIDSVRIESENIHAALEGQTPLRVSAPFAEVSWTHLGYRNAACLMQTRWGSAVLRGPWAWAWKRWREQVRQNQTLCNDVTPSSPHGHSNP